MKRQRKKDSPSLVFVKVCSVLRRRHTKTVFVVTSVVSRTVNQHMTGVQGWNTRRNPDSNPEVQSCNMFLERWRRWRWVWDRGFRKEGGNDVRISESEKGDEVINREGWNKKHPRRGGGPIPPVLGEGGSLETMGVSLCTSEKLIPRSHRILVYVKQVLTWREMIESLEIVELKRLGTKRSVKIRVRRSVLSLKSLGRYSGTVYTFGIY